jgi:hypothetical protein
LRDNGFRAAHPSTVAKIEAGDRDVSLDEVAAYAAVFGVSTDLLCRADTGRGDVLLALRRIAETVQMGRYQTTSVESELRDLATDLAEAEEHAGLVAEVEKAADALGAASEALAAVGAGWAGGEVTKGTRAARAAALRALDEGDDK